MAALIARGSLDARNLMVRANLGLVVTIARTFEGRGLSLDDLVGEGNLGLIQATEKFDPAFGTRFSTYAAYWIKQAILAAVIGTTATIRLPSHMVRLLARWKRTEQTLCGNGERMPDFEEVACNLGLSERQKDLVHKARQAGRLRFMNSSGEATASRLLHVATDPHDSVDAMLQADDERDTLRRRMERLNDRERAVLAFRFGLHGEPLTLREVGARLGLCGERVRRIASGAIRKLGRDPKDGLAAARRNRCIVASIRKELASESSSGPDDGKKVTRSSSTTRQN